MATEVVDPGIRKIARRVIDAVINSPCVVEVRMFSQPEAAENLENEVAALISPPTEQIGYEHAITVGWNEHNARRHWLIEAKRSRALSELESAELAELQWLAGIKRELQTGPTAANDFNVGVYIDQD